MSSFTDGVPDAPEKASRFSPASLALPGILLAAILALIVQNTQDVTLDWLFWSFDMPLWLLIALVGLASFLIGQLALLLRRRRRRVSRREARRS